MIGIFLLQCSKTLKPDNFEELEFGILFSWLQACNS